MLSNFASPVIDLISLIVGLTIIIFKAGELKATFNAQLLLVKTELNNEISAIKSIIDKSEITETNNNQAILYKITIVEEKLKNLQLTSDKEVDSLDLKVITLQRKVSRIEDYLTRKSNFVKKETEH